MSPGEDIAALIGVNEIRQIEGRGIVTKTLLLTG
jgi:hypothetical protein